MFRSLPNVRLAWDAMKIRESSRYKRHPDERGHLLIIWWATIGLGYILYSRQFGLRGIGFFFAGHILADLSWYSFVSAAVTRGRHFLNDRLYRGILSLCAVFLVVFACSFLYAGIEKLSVILSG